MTQLIQIPANATEFTCEWVDESGTQHHQQFLIEETLSIDRFSMFERFRLEVGMGVSFPELVKVLQSNIDLFERAFQGEKVMTMLINTNYNALKAITDIGAKKPFAVWLCSLFMNMPDEDRRWFDEAVMRQKISIWEKAGVDSAFFFAAGARLSQKFLRNLFRDHRDVFESGTDPQHRKRPKPAGEPKSIVEQLANRRQYWASLLTAISDGNHTGVQTLKGMDTSEFYFYYKAWRNRMEAMTSKKAGKEVLKNKKAISLSRLDN